MTTHTPGPWHRGTRFGQELYVFGPSDVAIIQAVNRRDVPLIAAAPDLLEALKRMEDWVRDIDDEDSRVPIDIRQQARAAIAKATGETI